MYTYRFVDQRLKKAYKYGRWRILLEQELKQPHACIHVRLCNSFEPAHFLDFRDSVPPHLQAPPPCKLSSTQTPVQRNIARLTGDAR